MRAGALHSKKYERGRKITRFCEDNGAGVVLYYCAGPNKMAEEGVIGVQDKGGQ